MKPLGFKRYWLFALVFPLLLFLVNGCTQGSNENSATQEPMAQSEVPANILAAQDAVLEFVREGAIICVPPEGAGWRSEPGRAPEGFDVYRFHSGGCFMSVSYAPAAEEPVYHVAIHNDEIGFCYQAYVDDAGHIVSTGTVAELTPELADASAAYCREQGYQYELREQPDGSQCGICVFNDDSSCKAWLYYQEECTPGDDSANEG